MKKKSILVVKALPKRRRQYKEQPVKLASADQLLALAKQPPAKKLPDPAPGSHEYLVANPPNWLKDPVLREYWSKWAATTSYTASQYGAAIAHFRMHAKAVVDGKKEPV